VEPQVGGQTHRVINRNVEGRPYWGNLTEITMMRAMIRFARPEITDAELDGMTYAELEQGYWDAIRS
jgi:hypothetical protein